MFIIFIIQMLISLSIMTSFGWDVGIYRYSTVSDLSDINGYFSMYPNNLFIFILSRYLHVLIPFINIWGIMAIINVIAIDISILLIFYITKKILNLKYAYIAYILSILLLGFICWMICPYSDTLSLPFTTSILACYVTYDKSKNKNVKNIFLLLIPFITFIGYLIKPTVVICVIAIILINVLYNIFDLKKVLMIFVEVLIFMIVFLTLNSIWKLYIQKQHMLKIDENRATPYTHFIMMGLNDENTGAYIYSDVEFTESFDTVNEKKKHNIEVIKERLNNFGFVGYLNFAFTKARWITSEGNFFWGGEGDFANFEKCDNFLKNIYYTNGKYYEIYKYYQQGLWILIMILITSNIIGIFKRENNKYESILYMTIFGIILFNIFFEARSRYLILYLPCFIMAAVFGIENITKKRKNNN